MNSIRIEVAYPSLPIMVRQFTYAIFAVFTGHRFAWQTNKIAQVPIESELIGTPDLQIGEIESVPEFDGDLARIIAAAVLVHPGSPVTVGITVVVDSVGPILTTSPVPVGVGILEWRDQDIVSQCDRQIVASEYKGGPSCGGNVSVYRLRDTHGITALIPISNRPAENVPVLGGGIMSVPGPGMRPLKEVGYPSVPIHPNSECVTMRP